MLIAPTGGLPQKSGEGGEETLRAMLTIAGRESRSETHAQRSFPCRRRGIASGFPNSSREVMHTASDKRSCSSMSEKKPSKP